MNQTKQQTKQHEQHSLPQKIQIWKTRLGINLMPNIALEDYNKVSQLLEQYAALEMNTKLWVILLDNQKNIGNVLKHIDYLTIQTLKLQFMQRSNVIIEIHHIGFSNLKCLSLCGNQIFNVEALCFINMPNLTDLNLVRNMLNNLNALKKLSLKNLQTLQLHCNLIKSIESINRLDLSSLEEITLDRNHFNSFMPAFFKTNKKQQIFKKHHFLRLSTCINTQEELWKYKENWY